MRKLTYNVLLCLGPLVLLVVVWELVTRFSRRWAFVLGSPSGIADSTLFAFREQELLYHFLVTGTEAVIGLVGGTVLGTLLGLVCWLFRPMRTMVMPYLIAFGAVPAFALGPMLIFWVGTGMSSKIVLSLLTTLIVATTQALNGAMATNRDLIDVARVCGAGRTTVLMKLVIPSAVIWVLAGIRVNVGMALLGAFIGEFISSRAGLGHFIIVAEGLYDSNQIWTGVLGVMTLSLMMYLPSVFIETRLKKMRLSGT